MKSQLLILCLIAFLGIACHGCSVPGQVGAPADETAAPTGETSAPAGETPAPTGETTGPAGETPGGTQVAPTMTAPEKAGVQIVATNDIVGIWELSTHNRWKPAYWLVREDGSFSFSPQPDGSGASQSGKYWFENNQLMIRDDLCPTPGSYRIRKFNTLPVTIRLELVADACEARIKVLTGAPMMWQLPLK